MWENKNRGNRYSVSSPSTQKQITLRKGLECNIVWWKLTRFSFFKSFCWPLWPRLDFNSRKNQDKINTKSNFNLTGSLICRSAKKASDFWRAHSNKSSPITFFQILLISHSISFNSLVYSPTVLHSLREILHEDEESWCPFVATKEINMIHSLFISFTNQFYLFRSFLKHLIWPPIVT